MKYYKKYMDRQRISPEGHQKLLELARTAPPAAERRPSRPWVKYGALAACCALVLGLGVWRLASELGQSGGRVEGDALYPGIQDEYGPGTTTPDGEQTALPYVPFINYQDITQVPQADVSYSLAWDEGSFTVELTGADIRTIFAPAGREELPQTLCWVDYALTGRAIYDGEGGLLWLAVYGEHPQGATFTLELRPGALPLTCVVEVGQALEASDVNGVAVTGWSKTYDWDGDGATDYICGSEFMAGDVGVRFESAGSPFDGQAGGAGEQPAALARQFNALFVRQATAQDGGLTLDRLMTVEDIPAWRAEEFSTLAQARGEADFAPYLPAENIPGYREFYSRLSWREGEKNLLFVRWSRGYDDVEVSVRLPEGEAVHETVDVADPAAYDLRLYDIPWSETVPEEYRDTVNMPTFRAEDMSLSVVEARGTEKDTGGMAYRFQVLHGNGTLVEYRCGGLTAAQAWALVEAASGNH